MNGLITKKDIENESYNYWNLVSDNEFIIVHSLNDEQGGLFFSGWDDSYPIFSDAWDSPDVNVPYKNYFDALYEYHQLLDCETGPEFFLQYKTDLKIISNNAH